MNTEEILDKLVYIQVKEKLTRKQMTKALNISPSYLCNLLNRKRNLGTNRARMIKAFIKLYENKEVTFK